MDGSGGLLNMDIAGPAGATAAPNEAARGGAPVGLQSAPGGWQPGGPAAAGWRQ
jgi:hypothetical protein